MPSRPRNTFAPRQNLVSCQECGRVLLSGEAKIGVALGQRGLVLCPEDFDEIHPLDTKQKIPVEGPSPPLVTGPPKQSWVVRDDKGNPVG